MKLIFFTNYLKNRKQITVFNNNISNVATVNIGIPQGSVLGPLLFLIFINDLSQNVSNSSCNMFADDAIIYECAPCTPYFLED